MDEGIYPMDVIKGIPGIYCWTDITRKEHHFKMGRAASIHKRLEDERRETSNAGHLIVHFILECAPGHEVDFEQFARQTARSFGSVFSRRAMAHRQDTVSRNRLF